MNITAHELPVRRLQVDLAQPMGRHWNGGDAFRTAFANALSMSFPVGEQFFIEAVRAGALKLPQGDGFAQLRNTAQGFIGQEATHRHLHGLFNAQLQAQGLHNTWEGRASRRIQKVRALRERRNVRRPELHELAVTAAYEHYTAIFGEITLAGAGRAGDWFEGAEPAQRLLWQWHAAEESEHRAVAFDLYQALGGNYRWRIRWFLFVTCIFAIDATRQTLRNLWDDGTWWKPSTWWSALRFFWGRHGAVWRSAGAILAHFRRDFHPMQLGDPQRAQRWLTAHAADYRVVGAAAATAA